MSTERIIVDERIAGDFVLRLADKARSLPLGDPRAAPGASHRVRHLPHQ